LSRTATHGGFSKQWLNHSLARKLCDVR
jgi:hypothetical protein